MKLLFSLTYYRPHVSGLTIYVQRVAEEFAGLVADRKGDIYVMQEKKEDAKTEYLKAYRTFEAQSEYRRLVGVKLNALGVNPDGGAGKEPMEVKK